MTDMPSRAPRSDAVRNRERLTAAARTRLSADPTASLTAIAEEAGVGIGTLYRHFPTREALILELYEHDIGELIALAPELVAELPPLEALRRWFDEVARYARLKFGVAEVIHAAASRGGEDPAYQPFLGAIGVLLDAGRSSGDLKSGIDPEDVLLQLSVLWRIDASADPDRPARIVDLIIDGLTPRRTDSPPTPTSELA